MKTYNPALLQRARIMRRNMTAPELRIWCECLRDAPHRFRRQRPIGRFIADFYCARLKLIIEVDGESHFNEQAQSYDRERSHFFASIGLTVVRFGNNEVMEQIEGVKAKLNCIFFDLTKT